jgi:tetratricopeptide (TPR) repeat protein
LLAGSYNGGGISEIQIMLVNILMNTENELEEQKRLRSINNCFNYSFNRLSDKSKETLLDLCLFNSPFLKSVTEYIFALDEGMLFDLFNRSFILRVELEKDPNFETHHILYDFHPIMKRYLREKPNEKRLFLQTELSKRFTANYDAIAGVIYDMLCELNYGIPSQLRFDLPLLNAFNLMTRHKNNDFEQAIEFSGNQESKSSLATRLSRIMGLEGLFGGSLYYTQKLLEIDIGIGDPIGLLLDYIELGDIFAALDNLERSLEYFQKALDILIPVNNKKLFAGSKAHEILIPVNTNTFKRIFVSPLPVDRNKTLGIIYSRIGNIYRTKGDLDKALEYHTNADRLCRNATVYSDIANDLYDKGNLRNALSYHHMALKLDKKNNDTVGMAYDYLALGITVFRMGDIVKALEYHNKALELYQQIHNTHGMITAYENIAVILEFNGDIQKSMEYKEKAKELELIVSSINNNYDIFSNGLLR